MGRDELAGKVGRIYMPSQDVASMALHKMKVRCARASPALDAAQRAVTCHLMRVYSPLKAGSQRCEMHMASLKCSHGAGEPKSVRGHSQPPSTSAHEPAISIASPSQFFPSRHHISLQGLKRERRDAAVDAKAAKKPKKGRSQLAEDAAAEGEDAVPGEVDMTDI